MIKKVPLPLVIFLGVLSLSTPAHAYLDAATGSILLQLLLGGAAGVAVVGRLYWAKIKGFFRRGPDPADEPESKEDVGE